MEGKLKKPTWLKIPGTANFDGFRLDLQGVRAIAIVLVLLAHAGVPGFSGGFIGIDIFFVLSGFLITQMLIDEIRRDGKINIRVFYIKRAKRLLPLAGTVLLFIAIASLFLYPLNRQIEIGWEIVAAAFYFVNWVFAFGGTDYFNKEFVSPVQHYWSLSVEEQFYLIWPALLMISVAIGKIKGKPAVFYLVLALFLASFVYSVIYTNDNQTAAYFSTLTRIWELSLGSLVSLILPKAISMKAKTSNFLVLAGIFIIVFSLIFIKDTTPFPGWIAIFPAMATVMIIIGGAAINSGRAVYILLSSPMQYLGNLSYSLYLWHWPFVVFAAVIFPDIAVWGLLAATLLSFIPAHLSHILIEKPLHKSKKLNIDLKKAAAIAFSFSLVAGISGFAIASEKSKVGSASESKILLVRQGIQGQPFQTVAKTTVPTPIKALEDTSLPYKDGCVAILKETDSGECVYGDPNAKKTIVLFGDSHALYFFGALDEIAKRENIKIIVLIKVSCPVSLTYKKPACFQWHRKALKRLGEIKPDVVVVSSSRKYQVGLKSKEESQPELLNGMYRSLEAIERSAKNTIVIGDIAMSPFDPTECILKNSQNLRPCFFKEDKRSYLYYDRRAAAKSGAQFIDPMPLLCRGGLCPPVIGDIVVYLDSYHITDTFSRSLSFWLWREINRKQTEETGKKSKIN